jgi:archaellum biogenesis ATPase FlaH
LRGHPKSLQAKAKNMDVTLLWLTDRETSQERTVPPSLERIVSIIDSFVEEKKRAVILLDDIQYLVSNTNFEGVVRFLRNIVDSISERNAVFMVSLSPESLRPQERSILEREMEVLRPGRPE